MCDWHQKGICVVSVTQQIDLSGKVGRMVAGVLFAIAEMDWQQVRERQAIGIAVAKKKVCTQAGSLAQPRHSRNAPAP